MKPSRVVLLGALLCTEMLAIGCGGNLGGSETSTDGGASVSDGGKPAQDASPDGGCLASADGSAPDAAAFYWAQWPMPNSASDVGRGAPHPEGYHDNGDGTVTDAITDLVWQQGWAPKAYSWYDAPGYCRGLALAGRSWRLPTSIELFSLADVALPSMGIDPTAFPNTPPAEFWSSTPSVVGGNGAWYVFFGANPYLGDINAPEMHDVRCVASTCPPMPGEHYTIASGTVVDNWTRLTWERAVPPGTITFDQAVSHCATLSLAGATWRLPSVKELATLVDVTQTAPMIDSTAFPGTPAVAFWTDSLLPGPTRAWLVQFMYGYTSGIAVDDTPSVRCVH